MTTEEKLKRALDAMKKAIHLDDYGSVDDPKPMNVLREAIAEIEAAGTP